MPSSVRTLRAKLLLSTVLVVSAVLTAGTAASVLVASDASRRPGAARQSATLTLEPNRQSGAIHALLDTLLAPLGPLPELDSATLRAAVALTIAPTRGGRLPASEVWIASPRVSTDSLSPAEVTLLRVWARSEPLGPLWGYRPALRAAKGHGERLTRAWRPLRQFVRHNEEDADSALAHGDVSLAMERARETLAASRHFVDQPLIYDMLVGRVFMVIGAKLLARAARQADEPFVVTQANRLAELARSNYALGPGQWAQFNALGAEPAAGQLQHIAADRTLPPAIRLLAVHAAVTGACLRTREVLLGPTAERREGLVRLAMAVADLPRSDELTPGYFDTLAEMTAGHFAAEPRTSANDEEQGAIASVAWMVPGAVRRRYAFCRTAG